jgi:hypothetical protein
MKLTTHLHLVPRSKNEWSYTSIPSIRFHGAVLSWSTGTTSPLPLPPVGSVALLATLHPLLENVLHSVYNFRICCLGAPFSWLEKPRNRMGRDLNWILCSAWKKWIGGTPLEHPAIQSRSCPVRFLERCKKRIGCQGRYFGKKRPSPHLHKVDSE